MKFSEASFEEQLRLRSLIPERGKVQIHIEESADESEIIWAANAFNRCPESLWGVAANHYTAWRLSW